MCDIQANAQNTFLEICGPLNTAISGRKEVVVPKISRDEGAYVIEVVKRAGEKAGQSE